MPDKGSKEYVVSVTAYATAQNSSGAYQPSWWLVSPYTETPQNAMRKNVNHLGEIDIDKVNEKLGVRPAIWIDIKKATQ